MKNGYIAVDFIPTDDWVFANFFKANLSEKLDKWIVDGYDNCGKRDNKLSELKRYGDYFTVGFKYFIKRKGIHILLSYQQFYGIIYAFFCRVFHVKKVSKIIIMTFIYNPKKGIIGNIYNKFVRYAVESQYIDKIVCFSKAECQAYQKYFKTNADKFTFILLGKNGHGLKSENSANDYILSAGRSNRDYDFLIQSFRDTDYHVKIVSDSISNRLKMNLPPNIEVLDDCFGGDFLDVLTKAKIVVIPLKNELISSGQLVLIQAMEAGVPVIVCGTGAMEEYISNEINGLLVKKDRNLLLEKVDQLYSDKEFYQTISVRAQRDYETKHTVEAMAKEMAKIVSETIKKEEC